MTRTLAEFMIITNRRYGDYPAMIIALSERPGIYTAEKAGSRSIRILYIFMRD